jgi:hypothetical protein
VGDIDLLIPKLRAGSFLPSILEPRRRVDQALYAVIMEAYIGRGLHPCPATIREAPAYLIVAGQKSQKAISTGS